MTKLIVQLKGGLGNQMFQYASARSLALRQGLELVLDDWSGFVRDLQYRRHYELGALPIQSRVARPWERLPLWLYRWQHRSGQPSAAFIESHWYGQFITETDFTYLSQLQKLLLDRPTWITGYWQSPNYFQDYTAQISAELMPPPAQQPRFQVLAQQIRESESVSLGVRLYEESKEPAAHAKDRQIKTPAQINAAVARLYASRPQARFFIFCTYRSPFLSELDLPGDAVFVTHEDGYEGTLETLWLLTQCRHHIFTNSSYYWWGAWLSQQLYSGSGQVIFAADNFINSDGLCDGWVRF
jgi:hypothetical protein